ncbi:MAG TPA: hypothetical protein VMW74_00430 [Nitrosopumilaceae archaeon]|nr:hypothetical protein [Nitrosopumilaceae archaeon]
MKNTFSLGLASLAVLSLIVVMAPNALANSDDGSKTYKRHWEISIGDASGTLEITPTTDIEVLKAQAISAEDASKGYDDVVKTRLGKAVNDSGDYFLVWKVVTSESSEETGTIYTVNVLDAGSGELLTSMTKEGGGCGYKNKSNTEGQA